MFLSFTFLGKTKARAAAEAVKHGHGGRAAVDKHTKVFEVEKILKKGRKHGWNVVGKLTNKLL